jgi:hypothetical protein
MVRTEICASEEFRLLRPDTELKPATRTVGAVELKFTRDDFRISAGLHKPFVDEIRIVWSAQTSSSRLARKFVNAVFRPESCKNFEMFYPSMEESWPGQVFWSISAEKRTN